MNSTNGGGGGEEKEKRYTIKLLLEIFYPVGAVNEIHPSIYAQVVLDCICYFYKKQTARATFMRSQCCLFPHK